jgi:hypothetical protein
VFSVTVTTSNGAAASGTVTVASGSTKLCAITLSGGRGHCSPGASALPVGAHGIVATYAGNSDVAASHSTSVTPAGSSQRAVAVPAALRTLLSFGRRLVD